MQFGFYTAVVGEQPLAEVARWAVSAGFDTLEIDVPGDYTRASEVRARIESVRGAGMQVSALTVFGNLLAADAAERAQVRTAIRAAVDAAIENDVGLVVTFPGRDESATEDDNYRQLAAYYTDLAAHAARGNVKILLENWPGPRNDYVATTPAGWARLFALAPAPNLGLNFDPSHLVWQGIDPEAAVRAVADRVFLAHAKDTELFAERLQQVGYYGRGWWTYRLPGHGCIDWTRWLALLRAVGFDGVVSIEHEDDAWGAAPGGSLPRRYEGLREGLRVLHEAQRAAGADAGLHEI